MENEAEIDEFIKSFCNSCAKAQVKQFQKGETITTYLVNRRQVCILLSGNANLVKYDYNGNRTIVEHFAKNSIFGEIFYQVNTNNEFLVEAKEKSSVLFFQYDYIIEKCKYNCDFHQQLEHFFPIILFSKITDLTSRIEVLSRRNIREKLLGYFDFLAKTNGKSFTLPFSITELANYLSVDRSAMSRELASLKAEKFIKQDRNKITLLY